MTGEILRIREVGSARGSKRGRDAGEQLELGAAGGPSGPRRFARRWMAAGMILLCSLLAVLFVANAIRVNELMGEITRIEGERDDIRRANQGLRAELTSLMSVERVVERAEEIGLVEPTRPPTPIIPEE